MTDRAYGTVSWNERACRRRPGDGTVVIDGRLPIESKGVLIGREPA